ncbi:hypothetical protein V2J09_013327 [Rumex salicifolius]
MIVYFSDHPGFEFHVLMYGDIGEKAQAEVIKECLNRFCKFSGEKVNFDKSSMVFSRKVKASVRSDVGGRLQIPVVSDLGTYLGVPVASGPIPEPLVGATVDELWDGTDWKWRVLEGILHHDHLQILRAHKLAPEGSIRDTFFWNKTPNGKFTTSSALRVLRGDESSLPAPI